MSNPRNPSGSGEPFDPYQYDGSHNQQGQNRDLYQYDGSRDTQQHSPWNTENPYMNPEQSVRGNYQWGGMTSDGRNIYITINCRNAYFGDQFAGNDGNSFDYRQQGSQYDFRNYDQNYQRMQDYRRACYVPPFDPRAAQYAEMARDQLYRDWVNYQRATNFMPGYNGNSWDSGGYDDGYNQGNWGRPQRIPSYYSWQPGYQNIQGGRRGISFTSAGFDGGSGMDPNNPLNWVQTALAGTTAILGVTRGGRHNGYYGY